MNVSRTPKRLKRDNFNLEDYLRRVADLDIKWGNFDRNDYLSKQSAYIKRREELLKGKEDV